MRSSDPRMPWNKGVLWVKTNNLIARHFNFLLIDAPSCRTGSANGVSVVGAARGETVVIICEVDADPPAAVFKWKFNNSGETIDVAADRYTSNGSASSLK